MSGWCLLWFHCTSTHYDQTLCQFSKSYTVYNIELDNKLSQNNNKTNMCRFKWTLAEGCTT